MPDVRLAINGVEYGGWKSVRVVRGIDQVAGTFELGVSELWPGQDLTRQIRAGDRCKVSVDRTTVITGYVDDVQISEAKDSHEVSVSGRDATGDLVDCSAIHKTGRWSDRKIEQIAEDVCQPFGIKVTADADTGAKVSSWAIQEGESAFECLERLARHAGVLLVSDGLGGLRITRAGARRVGTALVREQNILAASGTLSFRDRFSQYVAKGESFGTDETSGPALLPKAVVVDAGVKRYRPLIVLAEDLATPETLKRRAEWERNVRGGRSTDVAVKVQGWSHAAGLWRPNEIVGVQHPALRLNHDLLIRSVAFVLDESGTVTELALTMPEAFQLVPLPQKEENWWNIAE